MKQTYSSGKSVDCQRITRCYIPEDGTLRNFLFTFLNDGLIFVPLVACGSLGTVWPRLGSLIAFYESFLLCSIDVLPRDVSSFGWEGGGEAEVPPPAWRAIHCTPPV
jgi:hypothetical protein